MLQDMRVKKQKGGVIFDGASLKISIKPSHETLWQKFERTSTQRFTSGTFTLISCATLKIERSLCTTLTKAHLGLNDLSAAEKWLSGQETKRLESDNIKRPSTKWEFVSFFIVDVKVVLDRQPLLGTGPLPDCLRNLAHGRSMVALDNYQDNLSLWRCIAVH